MFISAAFETQSAKESLNLNTSVVADTTGKNGTLNISKICSKVSITGKVTLILFWGKVVVIGYER